MFHSNLPMKINPALCCVLFGVVCTSVAADLTLVGSHPTAPLTAYPPLHVLKAHEGRIYMGYGDYDFYPAVVAACYDPSGGVFRTEFSVPADTIGILNEIGGQLFLPSIDPVHFEEFRDFSIRGVGTWRAQAPA